MAPTLEVPGSGFSMMTALAIDAMYFHAARQAHDRASRLDKNIHVVEDKWSALDEKWTRIEEDPEIDPSDQYDLLEPIAVQLEGADYDIGKAYGALLKEIGVVHILSTATLEAHINTVSKETLKGKDLHHFERLALEAKWLFLPKILGLRPFDPGQQPFQGFAQLVKIRDRLVHYKGIQEPWSYGKAPAFLQIIGLTLVDSEESLNVVVGLVSELAVRRELESPYWLRVGLKEMNYFEVTSAHQSKNRKGTKYH